MSTGKLVQGKFDKQDETAKLFLLVTMGKEYIGKISDDQSAYWLTDVVQILPIMDQRGNVAFTGYLIGSIKGDHIDSDYMLIELNRGSAHWRTYYSIVADIKL